MYTDNKPILWVGGALVIATAIGIGVVEEPLMVLGFVVAVGIAATTSQFPILGVGFWLGVTIFIPSWTSLAIGPMRLSPGSILAIPVLAGIVFYASQRAWRLNATDAGFAAGTAGVMIFAAAGLLPAYVVSNIMFLTLIPYFLGRLAPNGIKKQFIILLVILALWGVVEFIADWHVFTNWFPSPTHTLNEVQMRAGVVRSEASLGHAIAYGATLVLALTFVRYLPKYRGVIHLILIAGIVTSFSRGPLLALVLTLTLSAFILAQTTVGRIRALVLLVFSFAAVYFTFELLYSGDFAAEVSSSGNARTLQLEYALPFVNALTPASGLSLVNGSLAVNGLSIVDSTPLRYAINYGWVIATLLLLPVLRAVLALVRGIAGPASIALVGQLPILLFTSMITQWQVIFYFVAGMAVSEIGARHFQATGTSDSLARKPDAVEVS